MAFCQVIHHRFLDPEAGTEVVAQKLRQCNFRISKRTVDCAINQYGLQKNSISSTRNARPWSWRPFGPCEKTGGKNSINPHLKAFLATCCRDEVADLAIRSPQRRHVEESFNAYQQLGWQRAGTMSTALIAQAACDRLRKRLGAPFASWDTRRFASAIFRGIDGDIRVSDNTTLVAFHNAPKPDLLREHYENLPHILERENADPRIPWLYNIKLDFRFR